MNYFSKLIKNLVIWTVILQSTAFAQNVGHLKKITLLTLDWPPYVGEGLPDMGCTYILVKKVFGENGIFD